MPLGSPFSYRSPLTGLLLPVFSYRSLHTLRCTPMQALCGKVFARCTFFDRNLHSRMPLSFTPLLRLKRCHACDQWDSSRVFTASYRLVVLDLKPACLWPKAFLAGVHSRLRVGGAGLEASMHVAKIIHLRCPLSLTSWHRKLRPNIAGRRISCNCCGMLAQVQRFKTQTDTPPCIWRQNLQMRPL
jgi:hypothetical protein